MLSIRELMNKCADELPAEWEIQVRIEQAAGSVVLVDPDGEEDHIDLDQGIEEAILEALEKAIEIAPMYWDDPDDNGADPC